MSPTFNIYHFSDFHLDEGAKTLKFKLEPVELTQAEYKLLFYFVRHPKTAYSYPDLYEEIFGLEGRSKENTIQVHVSNLRKKLRAYSEDKFITNLPNEGYRFDAVVTVKLRTEEIFTIHEPVEPQRKAEEIPHGPESPSDESLSEQPQIFGRRDIFLALSGIAGAIIFFITGIFSPMQSYNHLEQIVFISFASICYGTLFGIGALLECAYEFDRYGWRAAKMAPSMVLINIAAMFLGLRLANGVLPENGLAAFGTGLILLIAAAGFSCLMAYFVIPNIPIAKAKFQTQPAFAAFLKNVFLYFLPLYTTFGLLIYCLIYLPLTLSKNFAFPIAFVVLWIVLFAYSLISTSYLSDNLLSEKDSQKYHGLYFLLLVIRAVFCFGPTAIFVIWYLIRSIASHPGN